MPRFGLDSFTYLLSCILSTVCLAACSNSLVQRNHAVGEQSRAALAGGSEWRLFAELERVMAADQNSHFDSQDY